MEQVPESTRYWVGFNHVKHIGPARLQRLIDAFGDLGEAWRASPGVLRTVLEEHAVNSLLTTRAELDLDREMARYDRLGVHVLTRVDERYPRLLREIPGPPPVLYIRGELKIEDDAAVGIVGTRRVSTPGREIARQFGDGLAAAGLTVISGLARGIDGIAHKAAIDAGGRTIAVLGCGPDIIYPPEHRALAAAIVEHGALVSELPPGRPPDGPNFPARNRIISGMSRGVVVIEAPSRSGALITADFAADQGRDVFAVPGSVLSDSSSGSNQLLRDGARLVRSVSDLLEDLGVGQDGRGLSQAALDLRESESLGEEERRIVAVLSREPMHIDDVALLAHLDASAAGSWLMMLEIKGLIRNTGAQHFVRV